MSSQLLISVEIEADLAHLRLANPRRAMSSTCR